MSHFVKHPKYTDWSDTAAYRMAAGLVAATNPWGIISMGTFPESLVALGRVSPRHFGDAESLRRKKNSIGEELELR